MKRAKICFLLGVSLISLCIGFFGLVYAINTVSTGYQTTSNNVKVDAQGICKQIKHTGIQSYFVPTNTPLEWTTFYTNKPSDVSLSKCENGACYYTSYLDGACWLQGAGKVYCMGTGTSGANGDGTTTTRNSPVAVIGGHFFDTITPRGTSICGLKSNGQAYCWGYNSEGQLGDASTIQKNSPVAVTGGHIFTKISGDAELWSSDHYCGLKSNGQVYCWGYNAGGQIGDATTVNKSSPTLVSGGHTFIDIEVSWLMTCGIRSDGRVLCWGTGIGTTPTLVSSVGDIFTQLSGKWGGMGALQSTGSAYTLSGTTLTLRSGASDFREISFSSDSFCGIRQNDTMMCLGNNTYGAVGDGTTTARANFVSVLGSYKFLRFSGDTDYGQVAIRDDGQKMIWGMAFWPGINSTSPLTYGCSVYGSFNNISVGALSSCAIRNDGVPMCWGFGGMIGDGTSTPKSIPTLVSGGHTFSNISVGSYHACGIRDDGVAMCWGANSNGELGNNSTTVSNIPVTVNGGHIFSSIFAGNQYTCAIRTDGVAMCWGRNANGQLGDSTTTPRLVPTLVSGGHIFSSISSGYRDVYSIDIMHTCAVRTDGVAMCWGNNNSGQVGDNTTTQRLVPTLVSGGHIFSSIQTGGSYTCGLKIDGSLMCWGTNGNGQLGDNTTTQRLVPTPVSGTNKFASISLGVSHTCGVRMDGVGMCWGYNIYGTIGDNSTTQRLIPTTVNGGYTFSSITAGAVHSCGIRTNGIAMCWGNNSDGRLGDNTTTQRIVPTLVSGGHVFQK